MTHPHFSTGEPCDCTFARHVDNRLSKTAGKLHDFLMNPKSRPDLQTPEGQHFLKYLEAIHDERLDDIMPWLTREWKKGRIHHHYEPRAGHEDNHRGHLYYRQQAWDPDGEPPDGITLYPGPEHPDAGGWFKQNLQLGRLRTIADWYHDRNHPLRRGKDIMQMQLPEVHKVTDEYHRDLEAKAKDKAVKGGEVVHQYPDDWTLRKLNSEDELREEGEGMGNCVGSYAGDVASGRSLIYSLRDPEHRPHVTMEIEPGERNRQIDWSKAAKDPILGRHGLTLERLAEIEAMQRHDPQGVINDPEAFGINKSDEWWPYVNLYRKYGEDIEGQPPSPHNGNVVQIQGHGNNEPKDEYKQRLKEWFHTFPEETRPTRDDDEDWYDRDGYPHATLNDPRTLEDYVDQHGYGQEGEDAYGLPHQPLEADYDSLLKHIGINDHGPWATHDSRHVDDIYQLAKARGEIPALASSAEGYSDAQQEDFDDWTDQNYEYAPHLPDPDDPRGYENEEGEDVEEGDPGAKPYWDVSPYGSDSRQYSYEEAEKEYEEAMRNWEEQHPGMQATSQLYQLLSPHYWGPGEHPQGLTGYQNEVKPQTFSKVAANQGFLHYNGITGRPCRCPWNSKQRYHADRAARERYGFSLLSGQQLNKALKANDKKLKTDEGQRFLAALKEVTKDHPDADGLVPWFIQRFKKGDLSSYQPEGRTWLSEEIPALGHYPDGEEHPSRPNPIAGLRINRWANWFNARQHPLRRGVNVMDKSFDLGAMDDIARRHEADLVEKRRLAELREEASGYGVPVWQGPDGYHVRELQEPHDLEFESQVLGHCIGTDAYPYKEALQNGDIRAFSLRDPHAIPKATYHLNPSGTLGHVQGESGAPKPEYQQMIDDHLRSEGVDPSYAEEEPLPGNQWWDDEYDMDGPEDWDQLKDFSHGNWYEYAPEDYNSARYDAEERGMAEPQLNVGPPDWASIFHTMLHRPARPAYTVEKGHYTVPARTVPFDPANTQVINDYLQFGPHHVPEGVTGLVDALRAQRTDPDLYPQEWQPTEDQINHPDPFERQRMMEEAEREHYREVAQDPHVKMIEHLGQEFDPEWKPYEGYQPQSLIHPDQEHLFEERTSPYPCPNCGSSLTVPRQHNPEISGNSLANMECRTCNQKFNTPFAYPQYQEPLTENQVHYPPAQEGGTGFVERQVPRPLTFSKIASNSAPTYYRWVFSPSSGQVSLGHNWEAHPADVRYHGELAGEIGEPGLRHGYAYRIGGGWRLSDWDNKPLEDPFIVAQVVRALRAREGVRTPPAAAEEAWEPEEHDFQRFHYGLPA